MRIAAVVNERSGSGRGSEILAELTAGGVDCLKLEPGADVRSYVDQAIEGGAEAMVAAGGDGTISSVAQAAAGRVPIAVAPVGTRNHFAIDLGLDPTEPAASLRAGLAGDPVGIDVGEINGEIFLNNASFGIYAAAVSDPSYRKGRVRTLAGEAGRALTSTGGSATITTPGPVDLAPDARVGAILVANNAYDFGSAPGEKLRQSLTGGKLWIYLLGLPPVSGHLPLMSAAREILSHGSPSLGAWPVEDIELGADRSVPVASDGEDRPAMAPPYRLRSRRQAIDVLLPVRPKPRMSFTLEW